MVKGLILVLIVVAIIDAGLLFGGWLPRVTAAQTITGRDANGLALYVISIAFGAGALGFWLRSKF